ncbi:unnamed protein product, partial [Closterium sp. Naga37s-1]
IDLLRPELLVACMVGAAVVVGGVAMAGGGVTRCTAIVVREGRRHLHHRAEEKQACPRAPMVLDDLSCFEGAVAAVLAPMVLDDPSRFVGAVAAVSLKELLLPGLLAVAAPIAMGMIDVGQRRHHSAVSRQGHPPALVGSKGGGGAAAAGSAGDTAAGSTLQRGWQCVEGRQRRGGSRTPGGGAGNPAACTLPLHLPYLSLSLLSPLPSSHPLSLTGIIVRSVGKATQQPLLGARAVAALLLVAVLVTLLLAALFNGAGSAWRGARDVVEAGHLGGPGSEAHKATITGDTDTYIKAEPGESPNDRNDRAIRVAAQWYQQHLGGKVPVVLITDDKANLAKAVAGGTKAMRVREYVASLGSVELMDLVVSAGDGEEGEGGEGGAGGEGDKAAREEENRGLRTNLSRSKRKRIYSDHKPMSVITAGLQRGLYHQGKLRVSRYNCFEAFVGSESLGDEILVIGRCDMNRAVDGDVVAVELLPREQWKEPTSGALREREDDHDDAAGELGGWDGIGSCVSIVQFWSPAPHSFRVCFGALHRTLSESALEPCTAIFPSLFWVDGDVVAVELLPWEQWKEPTSGALRKREDDQVPLSTPPTPLPSPFSLPLPIRPPQYPLLLPTFLSCILTAEEQGEEESVGLPPASADDAPSTLSSAAAALSLDKGGDGKGEGGGGGGGKEGGGGDERKGPSELARPTGRVVGVIKRNWRTYAGSLAPMRTPPASGGALVRALFVAADRRVPRIRVETRQAAQLMGKRILVAIDSWQPDSAFPSGHYVKTLGDIGDRETESELLLMENDIDARPFSQQVLACLPPLPWSVSPLDVTDPRTKREDLRHVRVFSVDPIGCRDIDDALHCVPLPNGNFDVGVHIADVTNFVLPGTPLDVEASQRGTSVYLVERRIDMLPKPLTEDICSLRGGVERLAFSCIWEMTPEAEIISVRFTKSVIKSAAALSYVEAQARMDDERMHDDLTRDLRNLNRLAKVMRQRRIDRGALTLASPEVKFEIDTETHDPLDVGMYLVREANHMIEEFMLAANVSVAEKILQRFASCSLLRRHPTPSPNMFEPLLRTAEAVGIAVDTSSSKNLADSLDRAVGPDPYFNKLIRILTTRCMTQAVYFPSGQLAPAEYHHYGLAAPIYTHFTSPIRRYADVVVHRLLAAAIGLTPLPDQTKDKSALTALTDNLNYRNRNAQMAGRASVELHTLIFFRTRPTDAEGRIVMVRSNGLIVFVPKYGIEGPVYLVPKEPPKGKAAAVAAANKLDGNAPSSDWVVDEKSQTVESKDGKRRFKVLDTVTVHIEPSSASRESVWRNLNRAWRNGGDNSHLAAPSRENSGKFATPASDGSAVYIVRLSSAPPLSEYRGGIAGYPATATWDDGSDEEDSDAVPQMILSEGDSAASVGGESVDLDDTDGDHFFPNGTVPTPPPNASSDAAATPSARGGRGGSNNGGRNGGGGCPRHRLSLSMDRPQVAAFAGLLQRQQAQVASEAGVPEDGLLYSYKHTSNGFAARLTPYQVWRLRRHPAVASVRASRVFRRQTSDSPQFLGLPGKVWPAMGGQSKAGEGTVVGIVDTGIWPEHPSFSDKGLSSQLPAGWKGKCEQSSSFRCNNKVIGAKAFYAGFQQEIDSPVLTNDWLSPRDADGHGTWCAGAAAGNPVKVKGGGQVSGMAPAARIAVYKIFWTDRNGDIYGSESDIIAAVNQGVADGVDVLSLSLGAVNSYDDYFTDLAYLRANAAGVFVAYAAGNDGPPGSTGGNNYRTLDNFAPFYLTVGASTIARGGASLASSTAGAQSLTLGANTSSNGTDGTVLTADGGITFTSSSSSAPVVADFSSRGPLLQPSATAQPPKPGNAILKPDIIGPGVDLVAAAPGKKPGETGGLARMSGTSMATPHLAGLAALIIQKHPNWTPAQVMSALMTTARVTDTSKSPIKSATGGEATPWEMGAGHVFPPAMLDPGLTYDARDRDYQNFLAGQDLNRTKKEFPGVALSPLAVRNLNLPTITLPRLQGSLQVTRTVTNVGQSRSTYSVSGKPPQGVKVTVGPRSLTLAPGEKKSYTVTFTVDTPSNEFKYGYLVWADDQGHSVRSPLVVQPISR